MNVLDGRVRLAAAMLAAVGLMAGCDQPARTPEASPSLDVDFVVAEAVNAVAMTRVAGVIRPSRRAGLGTRQAGAVREVFVKAGDRVEAGQPVLEVDARDQQAAVTAARLQRQAAEAAWQQTLRNRERFERLYEQQLVASIRLEQAELAEENARGMLERVEAEVAAAQMTLDYSILRAPFDGIVAEIIAETGTFVVPGPPLAVFEDRDRLEVEAGIDEITAARLAPDDILDLNVSGFDDPVSARVRAVLPALTSGRNAAAVGLRLRLVIDAPPEGLTPGMVAEIMVPARGHMRQQIAVPSGALFKRGQLEGVFVIETDAEGQDRARLRWVGRVIGTTDDDRVHILRGLSAGERVVVGDALDTLADDQPVSIRRRIGN
mgnify:CR=1 FL=1